MNIAEMYDGVKICLCAERTDRLWISVDAEIKDGRLTVSGQNLGEPCEQFWGADEYEYWYRFDKTNTEKLLTSLSKDDANPIEQIKRKFTGESACRELRSWCEKEGILFEFSNWSSVS